MQNKLFSGSCGVISTGLKSNLSIEEENNNNNNNHNFNNNMVVLSSEESSSYPDEAELELGLGLSLGVGGGAKAKAKTKTWDHNSRVLSAKYFAVCDKVSSESSSSASSVTRANNNNGGSCGTKRTAEPSSPPGRSAVSQVVGWPPVRTYRMNSLANHTKSPATEELISNVDKCERKNTVVEKTSYEGNMKKNVAKKTSLFVKVNMDGIPIGRKVDLNAHNGYQTLARTLDEMFNPNAAVGEKGTNTEEQVAVGGSGQPLRLFDGSSDFVLTYEDKEGDWMLVGDVPWEMFLSSVKRLRIMRTAEVNGVGPRSHETNRRNLTTPI